MTEKPYTPAYAYPTAPEKRRQQRDRLRRDTRARLTQQMELQVQQVGVSLKCGGYSVGMKPLHAGLLGGCANDGSTCLCECHDQSPAASLTDIDIKKTEGTDR